MQGTHPTNGTQSAPPRSLSELEGRPRGAGEAAAPPARVPGGSAPLPLRPWAVVAGLALSMMLCVVSIYSNMVLGTYISIEYCMAGAMMFMAVLALAANPLLKLADRALFGRRRLAFNSGELTLIFLMLALVSGLVSFGFAQTVIPIMTGNAYFADASNQWAETIGPHVPSWLTMHDTETVRVYYEGLPGGYAAPWRPWVTPLAAWSVFGLAYFAASISLMVIMRKQWMENERLVYPIAQVPIELAGTEGDESLFPRIARSPRTWIGAAIPLLVTNYNALAQAWPVLTPVRLTGGRLPLFGEMAVLRLDFSFIVAGFSYLLNTQVSLGLWLFQVLYSLQTGYFGFIGFSLGARDPYCHLDPSVAHQATGGMIVLVVASLWTARRHLRDVFRGAWKPDPDREDPLAMMSYRWAVAAFVGGLGVMFAWLMFSGMQFWVAGLFLALAFATVYFLARAVAQAGLAAARPVLIPQAVLTHSVGTGAMTPSDMASLAYNFAWSTDVRTSVMASAANGLRAVSESKPKPERLGAWRRTVLLATVLAIVGGLAISYWTIIRLAYAHGALNAAAPFLMRSLPLYPLRYAESLLERGVEVGAGRWIFTGIGGVLMGLLMLARNRLLWWPVHPVGFVLGASSPVQWSWTGIFVAWLVKTLVLRYGGARLYKRSRDVAIGMVIGQVLSAGIWLTLGTIFHLPDVSVPILR